MANLSNINGKFVVEQTTGYVGIGDTDPDYLLHLASADVANGTRLAIENTNGSGKVYGLIADNTGVFSLRDLTASTDRLTISNGGDATFSGNVSAQGGTFTQAGGGVQILNNGTAGYNANIFFGKSGGTDGYSIGQGVTANDGVFRVYNNGTASVPLAIADNNDATFAGELYASRFILPSTGTTTPANQFIYTNNTNTGSGKLIIQAGVGSAAFGGGINLFSHSHASKAGWVTAGISSGSNGKFSVNTAGNASGTDVFTVDALGNGIFAGNVGIANQLYHLGETTNNIAFSTGNFDVNMGGSNKVNIDAANTYLNNNNVLINNNGGSLVIDGTGASELRMAGPNGYYSFMMSTQVRRANAITWSTLGTDGSPVNDAVTGDLMTLSYTGNVGIGTTSPSSLLTLNKASGEVGILLEGNGTDVAKFKVSSAGVNHAVQIGTISNNEVQFHTNNTERMRITSEGITEFKTTNSTAVKQKSVLRLSGGGAANGYTLINDTYTATESQLNISSVTF